MFACPNLNDKKVRDLVDRVGTLYYHYYTNIYGENIPDEVLEPKLRHEPVAKYVIDWLENANDWRLAIKGLDQRVRNTVESLLEGVTSLKEATSIIARQAALEGADGILYYPSSLSKYRQRALQSQYSPLDLAIRFYDLNYAGFTNTSASEAQIKQFFKKHGYDVEVKTATSGAKYIKYGNRMLKPMYNLNEGPVQLDEVKGAKVREFLKKLGVSIEYVDSIVTQDGLPANAAVTMSEIDGQLRATIQAVFGVSDAILGEEAAHILVATLRNTPMYGQLMSDITSRPEYAEVLEEYGDLSEYDETALKEEAVGKVIVKALAGAEVAPKDVSLIERILNYLKRIFTEAASMDNPYSKAADMILNPEKYNTQGEQLQTASVKPKLEVVELFESNPELANIGTQEQYSQYLDTIFPDSKVKDIVYHGSKEKFDKFDKSKLGQFTGTESAKQGFFFADSYNTSLQYVIKLSIDIAQEQSKLLSQRYLSPEDGLYLKDLQDQYNSVSNKATDKLINFLTSEKFPPDFRYNVDSLEELRNKVKYSAEDIGANVNEYLSELDNIVKEIKTYVRSVLINISNPIRYNFNQTEGYQTRDISFATLLKNKNSEDGAIFENVHDPLLDDIYTVFEPEQIHILGSKQDIQGFKEFVKNQPKTTVMFSLKAGQGWKKANTDGSIGKVLDSEGVEHYTLNGKEMQTRATEVAKADSAKRNKNYVPTAAEESRFEEARQNGSLVHEIADRIAHDVYNGISTPEGEISNSVVHNAMRPILERIIGEAKDRDPNVQIFTELTVVDPKFAYKDSITGRRKIGIGGTIDLLIVYSDGTADIYDYKTFGRKAISSYKLNEYNKQVKIYKDILEQGLPELNIAPVKVNKSRIIPVNLSIKRGTIIAANVADEVPVAYELTGNNVLDSVLITMYDRLATLNETNPSKLGDTERQKREQEIRMLYQAINKTLLDKNFDHIASEAEQLLERYNAEIDVADFKYLRIIMDKAKGFEMYNDLVTEADSATEQRIIRITGLANSVYKKAERKFIENFREEHKIDLLDDYFQSTVMGRDFRGHRQASKNPAGKAMSKLLAIQTEKRRDAEKKLNKEIVEARGKLGREAFNKMVNKATAKLIYMFDISFYKAQEDAVANNDMAWAVDNKVLDTEAFEAAKAKKQENLNKSRDLTDQQKQLYFEEWVERNSNLLTSPYSRVKDAEKWHSAEYKALLADPEAHAFYEFFKSKIKELGDMLEIHLSPTFIPKISAGMAEILVTDPRHVKSVAARKFFDPQIGEDSEVGNYDPITGKPIYEIPLYFMDNSVTPEQQSYDLDTLLFKFGEMAIEHKLMKEIEDRLHLLQHVIQNANFIGTTAGGFPLINKITKGLQRSKASGSGDIQYFENVMNYYLYGIKDKELNKFVYYLDKAISFNSIRVLGANPISGIVNYTAGKANQFIQSARSTYFTPEQLIKASNLVITRDKKAYELMSAMNFFQDIPSFRYAMANVAIDRLVDDNLLFAMLEYPEVSVQFSTAMAMMQNYTYYEGNIIRKKDAAKQMLGIYTLYNRPAAEVRELKNQIKKQEEALPSLYDQASVIDGRLAINGEVNVETNAFLSGMIQEVNKKIFGNMSPDDIAGYKFQIVKRILMQFRSWMPRTIDERFQELKYNEFLGDWEMGRYRSTIDHFRAFFSKQAEDMRLSVLFNPVEAGKIAYANYVIKFRDKYKKNPEITEDEFIEMHIANLKANIAGSIITVGALLGVLALGAAADDDDELKSNFAFKNSRLIARRVYGELSFYLDPYSLGEIIQRPAAIGSLYLDIVNLGKHLSQEVIGQTFGIEDWVESAKPVKKTLQLIPVVRPAYYLLEDWADQNNIELGVK